jgi:hypothetical protein
VTTSGDDELIQAWTALTRRIYPGTSTVQIGYAYREAIWDGGTFAPIGGAAKVQGLAEEVDALRMIFEVNERARLPVRCHRGEPARGRGS